MQVLVAGTGIAAGATALSFALAAWGFGNLYYASVFMPFSMLACLAVAWFSYLRGDGFARGSGSDPRPAEPLMVAGLGEDAGRENPDGAVQDAGRLDPALFAPRDGSLVSGRTESAGHRPGSPGRAALLWAAVELGAVSALLYSFAGLGSRFFR